MAVQRTLRAIISVLHGNSDFSKNKLEYSLQVLNDKLDTAQGETEVQIPTATVDKEYDFSPFISDKTARFILFETDKEISVKLNLNTNSAITVKPQDDVPPATTGDIRQAGVLLLTTDTVTKVYISNSSGSTACVSLFFAGRSA